MRARPALAAVLLAACGSPAPRPVTPQPPSPTVEAPPSERPNAQATSLCAGRTGCTEAEWHDAGKDADGQPLSVVKLALPHDEDIDCDPFEYWSVIGERAHPSATQLLIEDCNDGYGASGVGEDAAKVEPNRFVHFRSGGSAWRWDQGVTVQLSPLELLEINSDDSWTLGTNRETRGWRRADFRGYVEGAVRACDASGEASDEDAAVLEYQWATIPAPPLPEAFTRDGWRTAELGSCAASINAPDLPGHLGWTILGRSNSDDDARMQVVAGPGDTLYVEIHDDTWRSGGQTWLVDDHLELWLGAEPIDSGASCVDLAAIARPVQWGVRISDGKVFPAAGKPKAKLGVELAPMTAGGPARLKLTLPPGYKSITVVYSDTDDGLQQEAMIATSNFSFGKAWTLGGLRPVDAKDAVCELVDGALTPRSTLTFTRDQAVISGY